MFKADVAVIGGLNADIWGRPLGSIIARDSNPGIVSFSPGGVGRNIAHDIRLLGLSVGLVSAVGDDANASFLLESCRELGIDTSYIRKVPNAASCCYMYITDSKGDTQLAVNDMAVSDTIDAEYVSSVFSELAVRAIVLDTNIPAEAIRFVCDNASVPVYADPVSCAKAGKLTGSIAKLAAIKPNRREAEILTGKSDPSQAAAELVRMGAKRVFVSLGEDGLIAADSSELISLKAEEIDAVNTSGAGDAAMSAIVYGGLKGLDLYSTARLAVRAASLTCMSDCANSPELSSLLLI